ncbi:glutathione S-transferase family protein [Kiloniella laminariae]|uniref:glutathione S-transferase family protein n=1 Tax=Kiloniella laminariae TaxID=454162 RepID=UPI00036C203E|nr:glutathione S-transferase family protein [Kiloniella laminariae]
MYILYHYPYSQHARRVVSLLEAAGLPYELRHVAMEKQEYLSPEYLAINPNHQLPTLLDGDIKIHESNAILRYLCFKHELNDWYPADLAARAGVEQWLDWNQCRFGPAVVDLVLNKVFMGEGGDKAAVARGEEKLKELLPILASGLRGKEFLAGEKPSIADLSVGSNVFHLGFADALPQQPEIEIWFGRVSALKGFVASLPE